MEDERRINVVKVLLKLIVVVLVILFSAWIVTKICSNNNPINSDKLVDQGSKYLLSIQIQTMLNTNNFNNNISKEDYDRLVIEIQNAQAVTNEFIRQNVRDYDCMEYTNNKSYSKVRSL